jgi:hypothetical protein
MIKNIRIGGAYFLGKEKVKIVDFYMTGGPETGVIVASDKGEEIKIWCTDEDTISED